MRFILSLLAPLFLFGIDLRQAPLTLATSVVIPCPFELVENLPLRLENYQKELHPPYQVVVCLEQSSKIDTQLLQQLLTNDYPFDLRLICLSSKTSLEEMKNQACCETTGNILLLDLMDTPFQPKKVDLIKTSFEHYEIDFLAPVSYHELVDKEPFFDLSSISALGVFTTGSYAFTRTLFQKIQWEETPDAERIFIEKIQSSYKNKMFGLVM